MILTWEQLKTLLKTAEVRHNGRGGYSFVGVDRG